MLGRLALLVMCALGSACSGGSGASAAAIPVIRDDPGPGRDDPGTGRDNPGTGRDDPGIGRDSPGAGREAPPGTIGGARGSGCAPCGGDIQCAVLGTPGPGTVDSTTPLGTGDCLVMRAGAQSASGVTLTCDGRVTASGLVVGTWQSDSQGDLVIGLDSDAGSATVDCSPVPP